MHVFTSKIHSQQRVDFQIHSDVFICIYVRAMQKAFPAYSFNPLTELWRI